MKIKIANVKDTTPLAFGKYKGQTPEQVARHDPSYILWMWEKITDPPCTHELVLDCESALQDRDDDNPGTQDYD